MDSNHYLNMTYEELIRDFFTEIINKPTESLNLIEDISKTERYETDYEFRTTILTGKGVAYCLEGNTTQAIPLLNQLIDTATSLNLWELVVRNWNTLGVTYMNIGMFEKAVECFHNIVKIEKKKGLLRVTASAYSNIGNIFLMNGIFDRACKYYELALQTLKKGGEGQERYNLELQVYYVNLALAYSERENFEPVPNFLKRIKEIGFEQASIRTRYNYYFAKMVYSFHVKDIEEAKRCFFQAKELTNSDNLFQIFTLTLDYIERSAKSQLKDALYEEELLKMEQLQETNRNVSNIILYRRLREYYLEKGDDDKVRELTAKYIDYLEKEVENITLRQAESIVSIDELMSKDDEIEGIRSKNTELELVANEAIRHKNSLQKAYHQLDLIYQLGKKLTSSVRLNEVIELIYRKVSENIPASVFILMVKNEENEDVLDTVAFYDNGSIMPNLSLNLKQVKGLVAECYYQNKIISSYDEKYQSFFEEQRKKQESDVNSAIYMPLTVDEEIIGICSVQDIGVGVYTDEKLEFLIKLLPYLSISLNNAIGSRNLEKEIQSHLKTQEELKEAYKRLEVLSSLDGLTHINGRRSFGVKLIELLEVATHSKKTISIIMIDIDNFKAYNDNYGHLEGDEVLKRVAKRFEKIIEEAGGLAARFGGEEFIAACIDLDFEGAMQIAERVRSAIYDLEIEHDYSEFKRVTVSIGVSLTGKVSMELRNEFIKEADNCLYEAKKLGRNRVIGKEI